MEQLQHEHPLVLVDMQPEYPHYEEYHDHDDDDEEDENENDWNTKWDFNRTCNVCNREITLYHRYCYKCTQSCGYFLHKFCAELPKTLMHRSHRELGHTLTLGLRYSSWLCSICYSFYDSKKPGYHCSEYACNHHLDVKCVVASEVNRIIYHPSHPHPLLSVTSKPIMHECDACGTPHMGILYHCTTCFYVSIQSDCVFRPKKLHFQHSHPLILYYSFPKADQRHKFFPKCRVCGSGFNNDSHWIYKCDKCWFYVHLYCTTSSKGKALMSGHRKTVKDFNPDLLLHLPFSNQTYNTSKHLFLKDEGGGSTLTSLESSLNHVCHQHPLSRVSTQPKTNGSTDYLSYHNPMKKIQLLCDGCVRPITGVPLFKCTNECNNFVLHEWCARLPNKVENHPAHQQHTLVFFPRVPGESFGVFYCAVCKLPCNGFVYSCQVCKYYIDVNCSFIPYAITHEAHPNHTFRLGRRKPSKVSIGMVQVMTCLACLENDGDMDTLFYNCDTCPNVHLHLPCALFLPKTIMHKYDKHPMSLSYLPIENHKSEYFCEICERQFNPEHWFYHCHECVQSIHSACAPLVLESERDVYAYYQKLVYEFVNIKFGGIFNFEGHSHSLLFAQGIESDGECKNCCWSLRYQMIFKCLQCTFAIDYDCCKKLSLQELARLHSLCA